MENLFILNPAATAIDIKDGICSKLFRIKSILSYLVAHEENASSSEDSIVSYLIYQILLTVLDYLEQLDQLQIGMNKMLKT